jgi:hypothetical protein
VIAQTYAGEGGALLGRVVLASEDVGVARRVGTVLLGVAAQLARDRHERSERIHASTMAEVARLCADLKGRFPNEVGALQGRVSLALRGGPAAVAQLARALISNPNAVLEGAGSKASPTVRDEPRAGSAAARFPSVDDPLAEYRGRARQEDSLAVPGARLENAGAPPDNNPVTPAEPVTYTVGSSDRGVEAIARSQYGDRWRTGMMAIIAANELRSNALGSPIIRVGDRLVVPDVSGLADTDVAALNRIGGQLVANNSQGNAAWRAARDVESVVQSDARLAALAARTYGTGTASSAISATTSAATDGVWMSLLDPYGPWAEAGRPTGGMGWAEIKNAAQQFAVDRGTQYADGSFGRFAWGISYTAAGVLMPESNTEAAVGLLAGPAIGKATSLVARYAPAVWSGFGADVGAAVQRGAQTFGRQFGPLISDATEAHLARVGGLSNVSPTGTGGVRAMEEFVGPRLGRSGFALASEFAEASLYRLQQFADDAYAALPAAEARGLLPGSPRLHLETRRGLFFDEAVRSDYLRWLKSEGLSEGNGLMIQSNRWLRDPLGTGLYTKPDYRIPGAGVIFDTSLAWKSATDTQVLRFGTFSQGDKVVIIRPHGLPSSDYSGSYSPWR